MSLFLLVSQPQVPETAPILVKQAELQLQKQIHEAWQTIPVAARSKTVQPLEGETEHTLPEDILRVRLLGNSGREVNLLGNSGREVNLLGNSGRRKMQTIHINSIFCIARKFSVLLVMYIDGVTRPQTNGCQLIRKQSERYWSSCHCVGKLHCVMKTLHFHYYIVVPADVFDILFA